jgi:hypothetical protein
MCDCDHSKGEYCAGCYRGYIAMLNSKMTHYEQAIDEAIQGLENEPVTNAYGYLQSSLKVLRTARERK